MSKLRWDQRATYVVRSLTLGFGVWVLLVACLASALAEQGGARFIVGGAIIAGLLLGLLGPARLAACLSDRTWTMLGFGLALLFVLQGFVWAAAFSSMQGSDFGVYYRCGVLDAADMAERFDLCQGNYMAASSLYWERSLLYSIPLGKAIGDNPEAFDLANALYQGLALLGIFFIVRRAFSASAATVAVIVWGMLPERIYAITLATTDNLVAVPIIALFGLLVPERLSTWRVLAISLLLFAAALLRTAGPLLLVALMLASLLSPKGLQVHRLFAVAAVVALFGLFNTAFSWVSPNAYQSEGLLKTLSVLDLTSDQGWPIADRWWEHIWPAIPIDEQTVVALWTLATELTHHFALYPTYIIGKAAALVSGWGYPMFASVDFSANADTVLTVAQSNVPLLQSGVLVHRAITAFFIAMAMVGLTSGRRDTLTLAAASFLAVFFGVLLLINEVQPRYLFMPGISLAILAATPWASHDGKRLIAVGAKECAVGTLAIGLLVGLMALGAAIARERIPVPLSVATVKATIACPDASAAIVPGPLRARVDLSIGLDCAAILIQLPKGARTVGFLITLHEFPTLADLRLDNGIAWSITAPDSTLHQGTLGQDSARWYRFQVPEDVSNPSLLVQFSRDYTESLQQMEIANLIVGF